MIPLPRGCTVGYEIKIVVNNLTDDMARWFLLQGGQAWQKEEIGYRGQPIITKYVQLGNAKVSYRMQDGTHNYLIRFAGSDASTASLFLLKFFDEIITHNMQETMNRYSKES